MTNEKFITEVKTLDKFFTKYCHDKGHDHLIHKHKLHYKKVDYDIDLDLCEDCYSLLKYSFDRLNECPHDIKPRCRTCPTPCYEKNEWRKLAKLMRYSGFHFGLTKIKNLFTRNK